MLLAIDIGNTNITIGVYFNGGWKNHWRIRTAIGKTSDEYAVLFRNLLELDDIEPESIDRIALCSVVPPLTGTLREMVSTLFGTNPLVIGPGVRTGLRIRTDNPVEVGADIVASAVAAYEQFQCNCIVAAFGTALTFTAVADPGDLVGVSIAPGLNSAAEALATSTAQLPKVPLTAPSSAIGRNTIHSIQSGLIFGYIGMVQEIVARFRRELPAEAKVIATGGQSKVIAPLVDCFTNIDPWLTLDGIRIIAARNQ